MFRETLLESSPFTRKRNRWPMAIAVALEMVVCGALIALPFLSDSLLSIAAPHPTVVVPLAPLREVNKPQRTTVARGSPGRTVAVANVVPVATGNTVCLVHCAIAPGDEIVGDPGITFRPGGNALPDGLTTCTGCGAKPIHRPLAISNLAPGSLVYRVEPMYPRIASLIHAHGIVRLHAVIAVDGSIQRLEVIDGPPLLIPAAQDAVRQWRYRPFILNGQPVEVETMITVSFRAPDE